MARFLLQVERGSFHLFHASLEYMAGNVISFESLPVWGSLPWPLRFSMGELYALDVTIWISCFNT